MKKYISILLLLCGFGASIKAQTVLYPFETGECSTYYYDYDRDGYGSTDQYTGGATVTPEFRELNKLVCNNLDCDDTDPQINPSTRWAVLVDGDGDGAFVIGSVEVGCTPSDPSSILIGANAILENFSYLQLDCDDTNGNLAQSTLYYADTDNDGFGDIESVVLSCSGNPPSGYVANAGDSCPDTFGTYNGCPDTTVTTGIDQNKNYVHTIAYQQPVYLVDLPSVDDKDKIESVTYFDGMGRAQMKIGIRQSPKDSRDIKTIITYDSYGRANTQFLPYVTRQKGGDFFGSYPGRPITTSPINSEVRDQQQFYHNKYSEEVASFTTSNGGLTLLSNLGNIPQELLDDISSDTPETGLLYPSYSTNVYDEMDRVVQSAAPGKDWSLEFNHTIKVAYQLNDSLVDGVRQFKVIHSGNNNQNVTLSEIAYFYPTGELYKTITKDENWQPNQTHPTDHTTEEFKNKSGQVLLKRTYEGTNTLETYYVYDDFGNLTYVLPPMASVQTTIDSNVLSTFCYQYKYDHRNRLVEKRIPAKAWEYIVYDKLDRPVLTQDVNLQLEDKWLFTKYDVFGRVVYTGKVMDTRDRTAIQNYIDGNTTETTVYESRTTSPNTIDGTLVFYTNANYPNDSSVELLTVNYYDDYLWDPQNSLEANYNMTLDGITRNVAENSLVKTSDTSWTNAGLISHGVIQGDGYIQYTVTQTDKRVMVGLSEQNSAAGNHFDTIDYAIYTGHGNQQRVYIYIDGTFTASPFATFAVGDTFRVERAGNQILY
ncbi:MAG: DUF6443 domain-containing protein, partial [Bacteroidota bacterium]